MASATRALLWKEWREQRPIVITGVALAAVLPPLLIAGAGAIRGDVDLVGLSDALPLMLALVMWPLLAAACGAATVSNEIGDGTIGFLLSRPASRTRVWLVKVAAGLLALVAIVAGSGALALAFRALAGGGGRGSALDSLLDLGAFEVAQEFVGVALAGCLLLLFACAAFFSTFLSRAMTAAAAGVVAALAIIAAIFFVWSRFDLIPRFEPGLVAAELGAASVLVLLASLGVFARGETLGGRGALRPALIAAAAAPAGLVLLSVPILLAHTRLSPAAALLFDPQVSLARRAVVATAVGPQGESSQTWLVHLDGSGLERLTPRLTGLAALSPGGQRLVYLSMRGPLGMRADAIGLRVVDVDGGADRPLVPELPGSPSHPMQFEAIRFAPAGDRVAVRYDEWLVVASLEGGTVASRDLSRDGIGRSTMVGWSADGSEVLLLSAWWDREAQATVAAWDPQNDRLREIWSVERERERVWVPWGLAGAAPVRWLPVRVTEEEEENEDGPTGRSRHSLLLVDVRDGSTRPLEGPGCGWGVEVDERAGRVAYTVCDDPESELSAARIRFLELDDSAAVTSDAIRGRVGGLAFSPAGDAVAFERFGAPADGRLAPLVVHRDGRIVELPEGWTPLGWAGRDEVVLGRAATGGWVDGFRDLAVADAETGASREVHP